MSKLKVALDLIPEKIQGLVKDYAEDLEKAWMKKEDTEDLTVSFSAKFSVKQGKNTCEVGISFVPEKINDKSNFTWDDKQEKLPLKKGGKKIE